MEYKYFKNFKEMFAYARGKVEVIEPVEVKPEEAEQPNAEATEPVKIKKQRKKKGAADGGNV